MAYDLDLFKINIICDEKKNIPFKSFDVNYLQQMGTKNRNTSAHDSKPDE